jgi:predicted secreted Zn-dependent protease
MKSSMLATCLLAVCVLMVPTDADAKKRSKSKKSPQVAGFFQTSQFGGSGTRHDRVAGNDRIAEFFYYQAARGR